MSHFIMTAEDEKCVFLTYEGDTPLIEAKAVQQEVKALLEARQWHRCLVDVTALRSVPKAGELFEFGRGLSAHTPRSTRLALIVRPDQVRYARFIEKVARNGGAFLTFFVEVEKAEAWLAEVPEDRAVAGLAQYGGKEGRKPASPPGKPNPRADATSWAASEGGEP